MRLRDLQRHWHQFGEMDPMWAILSDPNRTHNRWDAEEFFSSGRAEVARFLSDLEAAEITVERGRCLDFGCGLGRVTQALCAHFDRCDGVDIAESMITRARKYNRYGERCVYHVNGEPDLRLFSDAIFDCVYSVLVLQHMEPTYSKQYMSEFVRVLKPGGTAYFQVPASYEPPEPPAPPRSTERLPAGAHRANITCAAPPTQLVSTELAPITVRVQNTGVATWPAGARVRLGNHWRRDRKILVNDDGRAELSQNVAPGEDVVLELTVRVPGRSGRYLLELDMVEEAVTWFADQGSQTCTIPVLVEGPRGDLLRRLRRQRPEAGLPIMEMHCVPRSDVEAVLRGASARVRDVTELDVSGEGYQSLRYIASREQ